MDFWPWFPLLGRIMAKGTTIAMMITMIAVARMEMHQCRLRGDSGKRAIFKMEALKKCRCQIQI